MPRKPRIDAPGALHHIMVRGIERREIFYDDDDRENFLARFAEIVSDTNTQCFAWVLIPNHVHLLMRTGTAPIATVMQRLLTGYAVNFNRRHKRYGHLFQNMDSVDVLAPGRYKEVVKARSVLCYWGTRELGMTTVELVARLGISQPSVSQAAMRGRKIAMESGLKLDLVF